ncbi:ABC transporter permease subunit [Bifidobacterium vansinderenii]|uniref:ABC transporter permease n=1 Tax=Bifidobacterium vansinderenii TaxID=1984871 RepID=A0A229VY27_9BIFI|nr:ABC transporter permease subunit [Bifidobacterium vansinderenii]OXN00528.1 ABC transporter permease [Bifidobacterium vansinderenii]
MRIWAWEWPESWRIRSLAVTRLAAVTAVVALLTATFLSAALPQSAMAEESNETNGTQQESTADLKTVRFGFPSSGSNWNNGVLGVALEKGYLNDYLKPLGYKAEGTGFVGAAPALHEALTAGDIDYVDYAGFAGILGKSKGIDTTLLAVTGYNSGWRLVASTKSGINSINDLKGKKVAYQRGATPQMYLIKVLDQAHLQFSDIEAVNAALPDGLSTLATGGVDAAVVSAGQEQQLVNEGKVKVIHAGIKADKKTFYEPSTLIARTDFAKQHPDVTVAVLKAKDDIVKDHDAFERLSAQRSGNPLSVVQATEVPDPNVGHPVTLSKNLISSLESVQDFELKNKLISNTVDVQSWTDPEPLRKAIIEYEQEKKVPAATAKQDASAAVAGVTGAESGSSDAAAQTNHRLLSAVLPIVLYLVVAGVVAFGRHGIRRRIERLRSSEIQATAKDSNGENAINPAAEHGLAVAKKVFDTLFVLILPLGVFIAWHAASASGAMSSIVLPSISSVGQTIVEQLTTGTFRNDLLISVSRILKGYSLAAVFGIFFGVIMGMSLSANRFFMLVFKSIRQIPMMAWVPLLVMWFGIGEGSKVAVIFLASFFPILMNTISGITRVDGKLVEVGRMYQLSKWRLFREIYLPGALPSIFVGLKLALGISWMAVVGSEMIAASSGIGFRINDARSLMDYSIVFAGMIVIAVAGVLMDLILTAISKAATPWELVRKA